MADAQAENKQYFTARHLREMLQNLDDNLLDLPLLLIHGDHDGTVPFVGSTTAYAEAKSPKFLLTPSSCSRAVTRATSCAACSA